MRRLLTALSLLLVFNLSGVGVAQMPTAPTLIAQYGRGVVKNVQWAADGQSVWVGTSEGTWQLDADLNEIRTLPGLQYGTLSPDGQWLAGYVYYEEKYGWRDISVLQILNAETGELHIEYEHTASTEPPIWRPDSLYLTTTDAYAIYGVSQEYIHVYKGIQNPARLVVWSPDSAYLAGHDPVLGRIWVVNAAGEAVPLNGDSMNYDYGVSHLNWVQDSEGKNTLYWSTSGDGGLQRQWSIPDGEMVAEESPCGSSYEGCDTSPNARRVAGATLRQVGITSEGESTFYPPSDDPLGRFDGNSYSNPAWAADNRTLALGIVSTESELGYGVRVIDADSLAVKWLQLGLGGIPDSLHWNPDDSRLLAGYDGVLVLLDGQDGQILAQNNDFAHIQNLSLNPSGDQLVLVDAAALTLRYLNDFTNMAKMPNPSGNIARDLQWQPDGDQLILSETPSYDGYYMTRFRLWDTVTGRISTVTEIMGRMRSPMPLYDVVPPTWKTDGTLIAIPKPDGVEIYDAETSVLMQEISPPYSNSYIFRAVWPTAFETPIIQLFRSSAILYREGYEERYYSGDVTVWREGFGLLALSWKDSWRGGPLASAMLAVYPWEGEPVIIPLAGGEGFTAYGWLSPAGGYAATVNADGDGVVWQTDGTPRHFLADTVALAWSADEQKLATVRSDGSMWVIDSVGGLTPVWRPKTFTDPVPSPNGRALPVISWSADGSVLAYRHNGVVRVWRW